MQLILYKWYEKKTLWKPTLNMIWEIYLLSYYFSCQGAWRVADGSHPNIKYVNTCFLNKEVSYHSQASIREVTFKVHT